MIRIGAFLFRFRNYLFPLALPLVLVPGPKILDSTLGAAVVGLLIGVLGQSVRAATIGLVYIIRGGRGRRVYAEDLVRDGIYAHSRNPMYVGNLLIISAVAITSNSWGCVAVVVPLSAFCYLAITRAEENYLERSFGAAYRDYASAVPRFVPRFAGLGKTIANSKFHWRRLLTKEYGTLVGWPLRWMLVMVFALWRDGQLSDYPWLFPTLGAALALLILFYLPVRVLKKRRILVAD